MIRSPGTLFRPTALARIRSPEQLDALLPLTAPLGWMALAVLALALAAAVVWAFTGTILRTATGQGVIMRDTNFGIVEVSSQGAGAISEVLVETGDIVTAGQVVARLDMAEMKAQVAANQEALRQLQARHEELAKAEAGRLKAAEDKLLARKGHASGADIAATRGAIYDIHANADQRRRQILESETRVREIQAQYDRQSTVRVARGGRVLEVVVSPGNFVQPGKTVIRLESVDGAYEADVYVPVGDGKKIKAGLEACVSPSTVRPEEYGYIPGQVAWVSSYPVTREYLLNELGGNEQLVQRLLHDGSAIELVVTLRADPASPSGFRWSSTRGPEVKVGSGTVCQVSIILERVRPIDLLFPRLRQQLGLH